MSSWLECGGQRFPLLPGANIIGRDSDLPVALNGTTVSRRHARIIVMADGVSLEDSGSKNGTFVGGVRAVSPVRLAHGDEIHIGALLLKFYSPPARAGDRRNGRARATLKTGLLRAATAPISSQ